MDAEIGEQILGVDHDVEQVRNRRALIAADIAHAGLQQRLGDRQDALAVEGIAFAQPQRFHFLLERAFHGVLPGPRPSADDNACMIQAFARWFNIKLLSVMLLVIPGPRSTSSEEPGIHNHRP